MNLDADSSSLTRKKTKTLQYKVIVKTSDSRELTAKERWISLIIFGSKNESSPILLRDSTTNEIPFRRGQIDLFDVEEVALGKINSIKVGHNESVAEPASSWFMESLRIEDPQNDKAYIFFCKNWFKPNEDETSASSPSPSPIRVEVSQPAQPVLKRTRPLSPPDSDSSWTSSSSSSSSSFSEDEKRRELSSSSGEEDTHDPALAFQLTLQAIGIILI